jgi:hypothetical protein
MLLTLSFILRQEELDNLRPFVSRLQRFFRNRRCRRITRRALLDPDESPFMNYMQKVKQQTRNVTLQMVPLLSRTYGS